MERYVASIRILFVVTAWITGCAHEQPPAPDGGPVMDYVSFVDSLRAAGHTVEPAGEISQPFFSVKGRIIIVNGGDVQVFEYKNTAAANAEAALVSPDGHSVGKYWINWIAMPHFYKKGKVIVLYVGDNVAVMDALKAVLGPQFAGG